MASPRRIFRIYQRLAQNAETIRDFQIAKGEQVSGTVNLLLSGNRGKLLERWGDEMQEIGGVLQGTHKDPYILEATQCFYWASLYAVTGGLAWEDLDFADLPRQAAASAALGEVGLVLDLAAKLVGLGPEQAKPQKLFLLWWAMDHHYRHSPRFPQKWSLEQIMETDLQEMKTRGYLAPILAEVGEDDASPTPR
jgi:hypothetical protein